MKNTKKRAAFLEAARLTGDMVRIKRATASSDERGFDGYVVGLSDSFVLLHMLDGGHLMCLNGYSVLPLQEIKKARILDDYDRFPHRALQLKGMYAAPPQNILLDNFPALLSSIDAHFPLVTLHTEHINPDCCYIGRVAKLTKRSVTLREINPAARWKRVEKYRYKDITRIDFGGGYEDALWRVSENERRLAQDATNNENE